MQYYIITNAILILFFIAFFNLLYRWIKDHINLKEFSLILIFSIGLTLIYRFTIRNPFFGLEYEDSYIFNFSGRLLSEGIYPISFLTDGINIGSLLKPVSTITYGGHFITFPVIISWIYKIFGYNINIPCYINTFFGFLNILVLSISFRTFWGFKKFWFVPGIIYSLSPAMNLFGTTQLSETFSSFTVILSILSFFYYFYSREKITIFLFIICFFTALLTKRDNIVLLGLIVPFSIYKIFNDKQNLKFHILPVISSAAIIIIYLILIQNVFLIEKTESVEISTITFSFSYFLKLAPVFISALLEFKWFSIILLLLIASIFCTIITFRKHPSYFFIIALYLCYFLIYTLHYRSYYFIHFGDIKTFLALRYLNNFYVISTLIISFVICDLSVIKAFRKILIPLFSILLIFSALNTHLLRKQFSYIESEDRFSNPTFVLNYLSKNDKSILITDNILIFQLLGGNDLELIDIGMLDSPKEEFMEKGTYVFLSSFNKSDYFKYRYPNIYKKFETLPKSEMIKFGNNDCLYRLE
jgi:hypothetical protein